MDESEYVAKLRLQIIQTKSRINSGTITNPKTLKMSKRNIKMWEQKLSEFESNPPETL